MFKLLEKSENSVELLQLEYKNFKSRKLPLWHHFHRLLNWEKVKFFQFQRKVFKSVYIKSLKDNLLLVSAIEIEAGDRLILIISEDDILCLKKFKKVTGFNSKRITDVFLNFPHIGEEVYSLSINHSNIVFNDTTSRKMSYEYEYERITFDKFRRAF